MDDTNRTGAGMMDSKMDTHEATAALWTAYLAHAGSCVLTPRHVADMLDLQAMGQRLAKPKQTPNIRTPVA